MIVRTAIFKVLDRFFANSGQDVRSSSLMRASFGKKYSRKFYKNTACIRIYEILLLDTENKFPSLSLQSSILN